MPPTTRNKRRIEEDEDNEPGVTRAKKRARHAGEKTVYSWNMQGASASAEKLSVLRRCLSDPMTYAVVLQECGGLGDWTEDSVQQDFPGFTLKLHRWSTNHGKTGKGNIRCSLATFYRGTVIKQEQLTPTSDRRRPIVTTTLPTMKIANIHAPRKNPAFVSEVMRKVFAGHENIPTLLLGDFNLTPGECRLIKPPGTEVADCGQSTHINGGELDSATASDELNARASVPSFRGGGDHALMEYKITVPG